MIDFDGNFFLRDAIREVMVEIGELYPKVVTVSADVMASCRVDEFFNKFPNRSFNVGIAEQDMISFGAGLAREGFTVFCFSMGPFLSMRACEQIRTDVAYNGLDVKMIGTYAGVSGGISGATHWAMEDCAIMRGIPNIKVLEPSDCRQLKSMVRQCMNEKGPVYIRVGIESVPAIYNENYSFHFGKADIIQDGQDGAFICSGITVKSALLAAEKLNEEGLSVSVIDMSTIKPLDSDAVLKAAKTGHIVVAQDHNIFGGLGDAVSAALVQNHCSVDFKVIGIPDKFESMAHAPWLYHKFGYDGEGLYNIMRSML